MHVSRPAEAGGKRILGREKRERRPAADRRRRNPTEAPGLSPGRRKDSRLIRSPGIYGSRVDTAGPYPRLYTVWFNCFQQTRLHAPRFRSSLTISYIPCQIKAEHFKNVKSECSLFHFYPANYRQKCLLSFLSRRIHEFEPGIGLPTFVLRSAKRPGKRGAFPEPFLHVLIPKARRAIFATDSRLYLTTSTGTWACCTTLWLTLPSTNSRIAPSPRLPITIRSAFSSLAYSRTRTAGAP